MWARPPTGTVSGVFQVRFHGRGGQGVVTAAELLSVAAFLDGRHSQAFPSFGSERTGAPVVAFCRIDQRPIRVREPIVAPDVLIVPLVGFDRAGYRLGYGGGYYDRTLELPPRPHTLGIAYSNQEAVFSHAPHDVPLDVIVTETTNVT